MSHDINSDHELWELTDAIGDRALRIWLEILSICDRNEGELGPWSDSYAKAVAFKCHSSPTKVRLVFDWALTKEWLVCDPVPRTRNHAKYHITREDKKSQVGTDDTPSLPSEPSEPSELKNATPPAPLWKTIQNELYNRDKARFLRLPAFGPWARKQGFPDDVIQTSLERFTEAINKNGIAGEWWPYLTAIAKKAYAEHKQGESERQKEQDKRFLGELIGAVSRGTKK